MARSEGQKLKLLYLKELLEQESDERHPVNVQKMLEYLASHGIEAERKAIYSDIACLQEYGMDLLHKSGKYGGYFLASRAFELPELKLLVDAVQSSRFLTTKKSLELIEKLGCLTSCHEAGSLKRQVVVSGRVKTMVESIYYLVDELQEAIAQNSQITFRYFEWGADGKRHFRPGLYEASPYALVWDNENYYLVAHSQRHGITHYRVDKMAEIRATGKPRCITPEAKKAHCRSIWPECLRYVRRKDRRCENALFKPPGRRGARPLRRRHHAHTRWPGSLHLYHGDRRLAAVLCLAGKLWRWRQDSQSRLGGAGFCGALPGSPGAI